MAMVMVEKSRQAPCVDKRGIRAVMILAILGFIGWVGYVLVTQLGTHAMLRHGVEASEVSGMFYNNGGCNRGPSAELFNERTGRWTYICFDEENGKSHFWILDDQIGTMNTEITAIPNVSKAGNYIWNLFCKGNRLISYTDGVPRWFLVLWEAVEKVGL